MNRWIKTGMLVGAILMAAILVGCKGDTGPAGPAGTATCMNCHTDNEAMADYIRPLQLQYEASLHATGTTYLRSESSCSGCHTTEGYQQYVAAPLVTPPVVEDPTHIGCFACHAPHSNQSFAMRQTSATPFKVGGGTYDKQESNTCAMCHQVRVPSPDFNAAGFVSDSMSSSRFGGHHGPQSNVLSGHGLWTFGGTFSATHSHNSIADGCVTCHMAAKPAGSLAGNHTFAVAYMSGTSERINSKGCIGCHSSDMPSDAVALTFVDDAKHEFLAALNDTLAVRLTTLGLLKKNTDGSYSPQNNRRVSSTGPRVLWTKDELGAIFNYGALLEDRSGSVHNPTYAWAALRATLNWANAQPTP